MTLKCVFVGNQYFGVTRLRFQSVAAAVGVRFLGSGLGTCYAASQERNRMSVLLHSAGIVRSSFKGLRRSIREADHDVMLHFTQKLGADAQIHVFVGKQNCQFGIRRIRRLRGTRT